MARLDGRALRFPLSGLLEHIERRGIGHERWLNTSAAFRRSLVASVIRTVRLRSGG